jgi:hypothetical protein
MPTDLSDQLVVALSSRALFDFEEENRITSKSWSGVPAGEKALVV